jgi:hypothetical protein
VICAKYLHGIEAVDFLYDVKKRCVGARRVKAKRKDENAGGVGVKITEAVGIKDVH